MKKYVSIIGVILVVIAAGLVITNRSADTLPATNTSKEIPSKTAVEPNTVRISDYAYLPGNLTVKKGTTITWKNEDIAKHTVSLDNGNVEGPNSEFFGKGESYSYTFATVGTYPYHCEPHPYMKGIITVVER